MAVAAGIVWWVRRGETAVPIALGACALIYLVSLPFSGDYSQAKALMIGSPLAMLIASRALLSGPGRRLARLPEAGAAGPARMGSPRRGLPRRGRLLDLPGRCAKPRSGHRGTGPS